MDDDVERQDVDDEPGRTTAESLAAARAEQDAPRKLVPAAGKAARSSFVGVPSDALLASRKNPE